jgi:hypothetical protein
LPADQGVDDVAVVVVVEGDEGARSSTTTVRVA